jgi:Mg2+ and Co2+ transporter CorA
LRPARSVINLTSVRTLSQNDEERGPAVPKPSSPESWKKPKFLSTINDDIAGHLSCEARLYLQDVDDQLATLDESLELFSSRASAVVDWCYNQMSFDTNIQVTKLT